MKYKQHVVLFIICFFLFSQLLPAQTSTTGLANNFIFSAIKGQSSKPAIYPAGGNANGSTIKWINGDSSSFEVRPLQAAAGKRWSIAFTPSAAFTGIARASLQVYTGKKMALLQLTGLSTKGLEGENEAPLSTIIEALGYHINIGWTTLANHTKPELQGDELPYAIFQKAGNGMVEMLPVARYSPDFELPFGYYLNDNGPVKKQAGVLAKAGKFPEHQSLFPAMASGSSKFDPGKNSFGFYATGPTHSAYSEDVWNMVLHPENAVRAVRIFPVNNHDNSLPNTYLVCFEEAKNGDYNDYVFLVKNIKPVTASPFTRIFNGSNLNGWHTFIKDKGKNTDPDKNFSIEDSALHVQGKELGYAITDNAWHNYHFKTSFKWGEKKWPPRENAKRDAGICYNIPPSEPDSIWPVSIECQVQEGDVGDFWLLGFSTITVDGKINQPSAHTQVVKKRDAEKPNGEWNTVEVISFNGTCVHIVNGTVVNYGSNASVKDGKILLQSEYAEVYYKDVAIRKL